LHLGPDSWEPFRVDPFNIFLLRLFGTRTSSPPSFIEAPSVLTRPTRLCSFPFISPPNGFLLLRWILLFFFLPLFMRFCLPFFISCGSLPHEFCSPSFLSALSFCRVRQTALLFPQYPLWEHFTLSPRCLFHIFFYVGSRFLFVPSIRRLHFFPPVPTRFRISWVDCLLSALRLQARVALTCASPCSFLTSSARTFAYTRGSRLDD